MFNVGNINRTIFREYDIRGLYEEDLKEDIPYLLGKGFGCLIRRNSKKSVCVAGDNRTTTPELKEKLISGLLNSGCDVTDIGIFPTPVLYFAVHHYKFDAGVMVTASHNPPEFNGFKMVVGNKSLYGKEIQKVADIIEKNDFVDGKGQYFRKDASNDYINFHLERFQFKRKLKIGIDTGNGTAGPLIVNLFEKLGLEILPLYTESDPSFPHHLPDPLVPENLNDLIKIVKENNLEAGLGYDGDGDRLGVVDENGNILWGDQLLIIYARDILKRLPGSKIIFDVKCSKALEEEILKAGGIPLMWKTGHSLIENKMHIEKAPLAGELSGHLYFADEYFGYDDAIYASLRLLRIMDETGKKPSELLAGVKKYYSTPEIRLTVPDERKFEIVEQLKTYFTSKGNKISDIDGVKVFLPNGWALVRASNTQPALVIRIEGETQETLKDIKENFLNIIRSSI
ncbi:MAG: phosphomannomutase/phosphoglucomutase [Candidatus Ratteibacteria bacterium]|nr:phosphomannomutase/phosphoglucomutase [Candidatus Ratteibacteria bacterium]